MNDVLHCLLAFITYIIIGALMALTIRVVFKNIPSFVFRKVLHLVAFTSIVCMYQASESWVGPVLACVLFIVIVWPILVYLERFSWYSGLFVEKEPGEIKMSLVILFAAAALISFVMTGLLGRRDLASAAVIMWGAGDAMAAVIGQAFGRHHFKSSYISRKTWEGTIAMFVTAVFSGILTLSIVSDLEMSSILTLVLPTALVCALVELYSPSEWDTVTVPAAAALLLAVISKVVI